MKWISLRCANLTTFTNIIWQGARQHQNLDAGRDKKLKLYVALVGADLHKFVTNSEVIEKDSF